ncbi:hypothetical protein GQ607_016180 [Colletotrichum asianum]|uniref:Secreted protein n=1 Tax=Colletotrichum asianum TaxID=702518 RepID=A0A8H3VU93_9PEZI|nr:hypothetical protein GQ607_016180 [Colletotrichum asianum]
MQSAGRERWMRRWDCLFLCLDSCVGAVGRLEISVSAKVVAPETQEGRDCRSSYLARCWRWHGTVVLERTAAKLEGEFRGSGGGCRSYSMFPRVSGRLKDGK